MSVCKLPFYFAFGISVIRKEEGRREYEKISNDIC
jgi:hypothetical protein